MRKLKIKINNWGVQETLPPRNIGAARTEVKTVNKTRRQGNGRPSQLEIWGE